LHSSVFEFTIVSSFSLITEILPAARGTMMSAFLAVSSLGRMLGALMGGMLWVWGGMPAIGTVTAGFTMVALIAFIWGHATGADGCETVREGYNFQIG
jgi:predicted MFS family arabinose efflux permease